MNRIQFQQWLEQFPEDTIIEVMMQAPDSTWSVSDSSAEEFDANNEDHFEYTDFTGNTLVTPEKSYYDKQYLTLGGKE